jgi:hypothetical protein
MLISLIHQIYILFEFTELRIEILFKKFFLNVILNNSTTNYMNKNLFMDSINVLVWIINCIFSCYLFLNKIFAEILIFLMERTEIIPSNLRVNHLNHNHESKYNYIIDYFNDKTPKKSDKSWFERFIRIPLESFLIKLGFLDEKNSFSYIAKKRSEENFRSLLMQNSDIYVESKVNFAENFEVSLANKLGIAPAEVIEAAPAEVINTVSPRFNSEYRAMTSYLSNLNGFGSFISFERFRTIYTWTLLEESILNSYQEMENSVFEQKEEFLQLKQLRENFVKTENSKLHPKILKKIDLYLEWEEKWFQKNKEAFDSFSNTFSETRNSQWSDNKKVNRVRSHLFFFLETTEAVLKKKNQTLGALRNIFEKAASSSD